MKKKRYYKRLIILLLELSILVLEVSLFGYLWNFYYNIRIFNPFGNNGSWLLMCLYLVVLLLFSRIYGGLKVGYHKRMDMIYSLILSTVCANGFTYLQISLINRWFVPVIPFVMLTFIEAGCIILWTFGAYWIYYRINPPRNMLVIYGDRSPDYFLDKLVQRSDKYQVNGKIHINEGDKQIFKEMRKYDAVIIWDLPATIRNRYLKHCFLHSKRCYITPKISDIIISGSERMHLFDTPLLISRNKGLTLEQKFIKRVIDIVVSGVAIIILCPLMLLIAFLIMLTDKGPVFYSQDRLTLNGRNFRILKFRSMYVDAEQSGAQLAKKSDDRITPIGRILRNLHLDEIPQLFNVFMGDMSIVGPRPERKTLVRVYSREIPEFSYRLKVKAGLTGYAQVFGKYNTTPYDKLKLDLFYIENFSFWLDIKLMFMTFKILFQKETSEGVEAWQKNALLSKEKDEEDT